MKDAMRMILETSLKKNRQDVRNWPAYLLVLLKKFDSDQASFDREARAKQRVAAAAAGSVTSSNSNSQNTSPEKAKSSPTSPDKPKSPSKSLQYAEPAEDPLDLDGARGMWPAWEDETPSGRAEQGQQVPFTRAPRPPAPPTTSAALPPSAPPAGPPPSRPPAQVQGCPCPQDFGQAAGSGNRHQAPSAVPAPPPVPTRPPWTDPAIVATASAPAPPSAPPLVPPSVPTSGDFWGQTLARTPPVVPPSAPPRMPPGYGSGAGYAHMQQGLEPSPYWLGTRPGEWAHHPGLAHLNAKPASGQPPADMGGSHYQKKPGRRRGGAVREAQPQVVAR